MVYAIKSQYDNSMSLAEVCHEFKLDMLRHEQEILEATIGIEYDIALNESEVIYENKVPNIMGTIKTVLLKFFEFIKTLYKKAKDMLREKSSEWTKRISEFMSKLQNNDKNIASIGVDCEYLNIAEADIKRIMMDISGTCYSFCDNMESVIDYFDDKYHSAIDDGYGEYALDRYEADDINTIMRFNFDNILMKKFGSSNLSDIKIYMKDMIIKKETVYSDDKEKFSKIKYTIDHHDRIDNEVKGWERIIYEKAEKLKKFACKLDKYLDPEFVKILSRAKQSRTYESMIIASRTISRMISVISELNSTVVSEVLRGYDQTCIAYMKLLKENPKLKRVK